MMGGNDILIIVSLIDEVLQKERWRPRTNNTPTTSTQENNNSGDDINNNNDNIEIGAVHINERAPNINRRFFQGIGGARGVNFCENHSDDFVFLIVDENLDVFNEDSEPMTISGSMCVESIRKRLPIRLEKDQLYRSSAFHILRE